MQIDLTSWQGRFYFKYSRGECMYVYNYLISKKLFNSYN